MSFVNEILRDEFDKTNQPDYMELVMLELEELNQREEEEKEKELSSFLLKSNPNLFQSSYTGLEF